MRRFKIGDKVRIARIADKYNTPEYSAYISEWQSMIGSEYLVIGYGASEDSYELDIDESSLWLDEELESKETQVLEILRQYRDNKRPDKQAVRDSGIQPDL